MRTPSLDLKFQASFTNTEIRKNIQFDTINRIQKCNNKQGVPSRVLGESPCLFHLEVDAFVTTR